MSKQPLGSITTLLDLTDRDGQEDDLFPLTTEVTWFTRDRTRRTIIFSPIIQTIPFRGPAEFGQHFVFDIGSQTVGDLLFGAFLQINLNHWLDAGIQNRLAAGLYTYTDPQTAWEYVNSLGTAIIKSAELEIDGKTVETIDGDFSNIFNLLYTDYNTQFGIAEQIGKVPISTLITLDPRLFPTEDGIIHCPLPFFFGRIARQEALPLTAIKEGSTKIHIYLRPFSEVVRQLQGFKACDGVPTSQTISFTDTTTQATVLAETSVAIPQMKSVALVTHGALVDGEFRQHIMRKPFEMIHRELQTFYFDEPKKYIISKGSDTIHLQLPLEANHPIEEIIWFVRQKGTSNNNEWTNYSDTLEANWSNDRTFLTKPLLKGASLQVNGITMVNESEQYFRQHIARKHKGGYAAFSEYIYGYTFAERPGDHQPTGSINASRASSLRLNLEVTSDVEWEVKVYCIALNWMRFENGLANAIFED